VELRLRSAQRCKGAKGTKERLSLNASPESYVLGEAGRTKKQWL